MYSRIYFIKSYSPALTSPQQIIDHKQNTFRPFWFLLEINTPDLSADHFINEQSVMQIWTFRVLLVENLLNTFLKEFEARNYLGYAIVTEDDGEEPALPEPEPESINYDDEELPDDVFG